MRGRKKHACKCCGRTFDVRRRTARDSKGRLRWYYVCAVCDWEAATGRKVITL